MDKFSRINLVKSTARAGVTKDAKMIESFHAWNFYFVAIVLII
jgi:hypothetical protein